VALVLAGCSGGSGPLAFSGIAEVGRTEPATLTETVDGRCYARDVAPAVIETVTEQTLVQPAQLGSDGSVLYPAVYRTEKRQKIVRPRKELWFEIPCEEDLTPDFIASLQRALAARGFYHGAVTGKIDARTRRAVRAYQRQFGLDSAVLSLAAARRLGLAKVGPEEAPAEFDPDPTDLPG
jgi:hypothetical protein